MPHKAAAYDLAKHLDPDVRDQLLDPDATNDVVDVAKALMDSHTPVWVFYYLAEVETPKNTGKLLAEYVDDETIHETAERYAGTDNVVINFNNPASHNWMSEDPMAPARRRYEDKLADIKAAFQDAYRDILGGELPHFDEAEFLEWISEDLVEDMNALQWAVWEQHAEEQGTDDPLQTVAEWHVRQTQPNQLATAMATYEAREDSHEAYLEAREEYLDEYGLYSEHLADRDPSDDEGMPVVFVWLPSRDVPMSTIKAWQDDE